jgi:hypothetical protein
MKQKITIDGTEYIKKQEFPTKEGKRYCIIRGKNSGVHAGYLKKFDIQFPTVVELEITRRLWKWFGRTLSGLALEGTNDETKCKFGPEISEIVITDVCEIIRCTEDSIKSLRSVRDWENE